MTGELVYEIKKHTEWVYALEFSPDNVLLATADRNGGLYVWEAATGTLRRSQSAHDVSVSAVAFGLMMSGLPAVIAAAASLSGTILGFVIPLAHAIALSANLADMARRAKTGEEIAELQEVVKDAQPGNDAGPAVSGVLGRLREQRAR